MIHSCYEEMTDKDEQKKLLVYDDAAGGCGNGRAAYKLRRYRLTRSQVFTNNASIHGLRP